MSKSKIDKIRTYIRKEIRMSKVSIKLFVGNTELETYRIPRRKLRSAIKTDGIGLVGVRDVAIKLLEVDRTGTLRVELHVNNKKIDDREFSDEEFLSLLRNDRVAIEGITDVALKALEGVK